MASIRKSSKGATYSVVTRSDVRKATIHGLNRTKADPRSLKITPGQRRHITSK